jgi:hypothetical protein
MKTTPLITFGALLSLWAICATPAVAAEAPADDFSSYSTEELTAVLTEQLTSIDSLYCEYEIHYGDAPHPVRCRYASSGNMWHYTELSADQGKVKENTTCCDGSVVYAFVVTRSQGGEDQWGSVQLQDPRDTVTLAPECLLGKIIRNVDRSVVDVLQWGEVARSEETFPDGTPGIRLAVCSVSSANVRAKGTKYDVAVTLDQAHDLLPRDMLTVQSEVNRDWPEWAQHWTLLEYRQVVDERTKEQRWFPVSGVLEQGQTNSPRISITIDEVRVNAALASSLFQPEVPDGTTLADARSNGSGRVGIKGKETVVDRRIAGLARQTQPEPRRLLTVFLWGAVPLLCVLAIWYVWRLRIKSSSIEKRGKS